MGYSHYFYTHKNGIPVAAWKKITSDTRKLLANLPSDLQIAWDEDEPNKVPEVSDSLIRFNGIGAEGHETFYFERVPDAKFADPSEGDTVFNFCKTAAKPYDLVVCGVLIAAAKHAGRYIRVTSDGGLDDWKPAFDWAVSVLGTEYAAGAVAARLNGEFQLGGDPTPEPEESAEVPCGTPDVEAANSLSPAALLDAAKEAEALDEPVAVEPKPEPVTSSHTLSVDAKEFREALEFAVGIAEKKATMPILTTVCLQPQGSSLRVLSTDLELWAFTDIPAIIDEGAENVTLPHKKTLELLKGETGILKITASVTRLKEKFSHAWVKLEVGGCEYDIHSIDAGNFPKIPDVPPVGFTILGSALKETLGRTMQCISTEESRYTINGGLFDCFKDKLIVVTTDGHRLAKDSIWVEDIPKGKATVRTSAIKWLYKNVEGQVNVSLGEEYSCFHFGKTTLVTRTIKGQFPNYDVVIPAKKDFNLSATFPSAVDLAKTLAKVARMADERSGAVKFLVNGAVTLSAESTDAGKASSTVNASIEHFGSEEVIKMGFNSSFIQDFLKIAGKNPVVLSLKDAGHAGVFTVPALPEYTHVIMPMRV